MYTLSPREDYSLPESPLKNDLESCIFSLYDTAQQSSSDDTKRAIEDGLYLAVKKRMTQREYTGDNTAYITGLLSDVSGAKYEFSQVAYDNMTTADVFFTLKKG